MVTSSITPNSPGPHLEVSPDAIAAVFRPDDPERLVGWLHEELKALWVEHSAILKRIGVIKKTVTGLAEVFGPSVLTVEMQSLLCARPVPRDRSRLGPTALCRQLLSEASEPLTVREIVARAQEKYPGALAHHRDPAASLRILLGRLVSYGEAEEILNPGGLRAWKWTAKPDCSHLPYPDPVDPSDQSSSETTNL